MHAILYHKNGFLSNHGKQSQNLMGFEEDFLKPNTRTREYNNPHNVHAIINNNNQRFGHLAYVLITHNFRLFNPVIVDVNPTLDIGSSLLFVVNP